MRHPTSPPLSISALHLVMLPLLLLLAVAGGAQGAVPYTGAMTTFGHSIKNGQLPAHTDLLVFEHNCTSAPCAITQLHVPSIYPRGGEAWDWQDGRICFFVDGEAAPSINVSILELAWVGRYGSVGRSSLDNHGAPWLNSHFGHTAKSGGVSSTIRIPFGTNIKVTFRAPAAAQETSVFWLIVRGIEAFPVTLGDIELPAGARLKTYRIVDKVLQKLELVTLASTDSSKSGALVGVKFDAEGGSGVGYTYLEACMRFYPDGATSPVFLSSGAEDYFLSASYFDEGEFVGDNAGLTFFDGHGGLSAYKLHLNDPVLFKAGMTLQFRMGEDTAGCGSTAQCPNQFCPPNTPARHWPDSGSSRGQKERAAGPAGARSGRGFQSRGNGNCTGIGPVAQGFDRPGDDHDCFTMPVNATPQDCAMACCNEANCQAWVYAISPGPYLKCKKAGDTCCWLKTGVTQITPSPVPKIASGVVAGHPGGTPPAPAPAPPTPPAPQPAAGTANYNTLVYVYEWPTTEADTPGGSGAAGQDAEQQRRAAVKAVVQLVADGVLDAAAAGALLDRVLAAGEASEAAKAAIALLLTTQSTSGP